MLPIFFWKMMSVINLCNSLCNHVRNMISFMNKNNGTFSLFLFQYILNPINTLLTTLIRSRLLDIGLAFFGIFMDFDSVLVHEHAKNKLGQYPTILASGLNWSIIFISYNLIQFDPIANFQICKSKI